MAKKKKKVYDQDVAEIPIASMIDVVFLLIIFFVVTAAMEKDVIDQYVCLADAPHGKALETINPNSVIINLRKDGRIAVSDIIYTEEQLSNLIKTRAQEWYANDPTKMPIIVRGDKRVKHGYIRKVLDAITATELYGVKFMAVIE